MRIGGGPLLKPPPCKSGTSYIIIRGEKQLKEIVLNTTMDAK
jgi:hypothetical protein